jgi:transcriptional regulator with XRE-family HTH domain
MLLQPRILLCERWTPGMKKKITDQKALGAILKARRQAVGVTQKTLADYCDLHHNRISQIELGNSDIKLSTLLKLAKFLGLDLLLETES